MLKPFLARFGLDAVSRLLVFVISILVARKLSVSDFGVFTYAISLANVLYVFTELGTNNYILKEVGKNPKLLASFYSQAVFLKSFLALAVMIVAMIFLPFLWPWKYPLIFLCAMGWILGNSFVDLYQMFCNAVHDFKLAGKIMLSSRFLLIISALILFAADKITLSSILVVYLFGSLLGAVWAGFISISSLRVKLAVPVFASVKKLFMESLPLGLGGIFALIYLKADTILITWLLGSAETGIYGAAFKLFEMTYAVSVVLMVVMTPMLARARDDGGNSFRKITKNAVILSSLIAMAWLFLCILGSEFIVMKIYGARYLSAAPLLVILAFANAAAFFSNILSYMLVIEDRRKRFALNHGIAMIVNLLLNVILIYNMGAKGAAWAVLATQITLIAAGLSAFSRKDGKNENRN